MTKWVIYTIISAFFGAMLGEAAQDYFLIKGGSDWYDWGALIAVSIGFVAGLRNLVFGIGK